MFKPFSKGSVNIWATCSLCQTSILTLQGCGDSAMVSQLQSLETRGLIVISLRNYSRNWRVFNNTLGLCPWSATNQSFPPNVTGSKVAAYFLCYLLWVQNCPVEYTKTNVYSLCVPIKLYLPKQVKGLDLAHLLSALDIRDGQKENKSLYSEIWGTCVSGRYIKRHNSSCHL